jgi:hypothetical protein
MSRLQLLEPINDQFLLRFLRASKCVVIGRRGCIARRPKYPRAGSSSRLSVVADVTHILARYDAVRAAALHLVTTPHSA